MISYLIGTRAQLVKMAPVLQESERKKVPFQLVFTGQHQVTMDDMLSEFGIKAKPVRIGEARDITSVLDMFFWFIKTYRILSNPVSSPLVSGRGNDIVVVHGDTMSTLVGALAARRLGIDVAHVEAGLRSRHLFHPFPEEITRRIVFRLTNIAFCPGDWAYENMERYGSRKINVEANTILDALRYVINKGSYAMDEPLPDNYGVVSLHRFENIFKCSRLASIISALKDVAKEHQLIFVMHPATMKRLDACGLRGELESEKQIRLMPRIGYMKFVHVLQGADFVITDGGSNQEELYYLGVPTFLMRKSTERQEGIGTTVLIGSYDKNKLMQFVDGAERNEPTYLKSNEAPSSRIVEYLQPYC